MSREDFVRRDPVTGKKGVNPLNREKPNWDEIDEMMLEDE